ncbi:MAG: hypothetical protein L6422_06310 [Candidatus Marinimicrobia bacterium]|nr:hypothetical protein [bacterium]MCG2715881.1 hypothetical protein [Candidatus Neomarinimicrobiota bacterium]
MTQQSDHIKSFYDELLRTRLFSFINATPGFVHNISNPLTIIATRAQLLQLKMLQNTDFKKMVEQSKIIESMLNNIVYISRNILDQKFKLLNINELLKNELTFLLTDLFFKHNVEKKYQLHPNLPKTKGVYFHISTVFFCVMQLQFFLMRDAVEKKVSVRTSEKDNNIIIDITGTGERLSEVEVNQIFSKSINLETDDIKPKQLLINNLAKSCQITSDDNIILVVESNPYQTHYQMVIPIIHE